MKINSIKSILFLILIFAAGFTIRLYQLSFFEYKTDQHFAITMGNETRAAHFIIFHGMRSGTGLDNPPFFAYFMGVLTAFTNDPAKLTFCFFCINMLALILAIIYFYRTLPDKYAILSAAFLALFPAFTIYSNNIWAQCLLPIFMILFNICLYRFIKYEIWRNFFFMGLLVNVAAQIHGSGFMLYPLLAIIVAVYWKKIDKKIILLTLLATVVLFIPYLIHLLKEHDASNVVRYGASAKRVIEFKIFVFHVRMASFDFFRSYFKFDLNKILKIAVGGWSYILYPLTFIPIILFITGFINYIRWLMKGKIFDKTEGNSQEYPIPFQISGFMILVVTLGYLFFRIPTSMHYCIVLFPAYSVLTGFAAFKIWKFYWGKIIVLLGILSTVILLIGTLMFLDRAGGHYGYGVSYKTLISWQKEIQAMKNKGECLNLKVNVVGHWGKILDATDDQTAFSVLNENNVCKSGDKIVPAQINIGWNNKLMHYDLFLFSAGRTVKLGP